MPSAQEEMDTQEESLLHSVASLWMSLAAQLVPWSICLAHGAQQPLTSLAFSHQM